MLALPVLPRILLCGLLLSSATGCHHRSDIRETLSASERGVVTQGIHAMAHTSTEIDSWKPNESGDVKTTRIEDLFTGRFAGVQVLRTATGKPSVRIRGAEPLVVVDGLEGDSHLLLGLRPQEIERIAILKDPGSTSIYGERGLNGVIVITTKRGR